MKKFLVIKVLNIFSPIVESSFDDLNDAKKYASLCKKKRATISTTLLLLDYCRQKVGES